MLTFAQGELEALRARLDSLKLNDSCPCGSAHEIRCIGISVERPRCTIETGTLTDAGAIARSACSNPATKTIRLADGEFDACDTCTEERVKKVCDAAEIKAILPVAVGPALTLACASCCKHDDRSCNRKLVAIARTSFKVLVEYQALVEERRIAREHGQAAVEFSRAEAARAHAEKWHQTAVDLWRKLLHIELEAEAATSGMGDLLGDDTAIEQLLNAPPRKTPTLDEVEREHILRVVALSDGNRRLAASRLGIGERTLYRKLTSYGVVGPTEPAPPAEEERPAP